MQNHLRRERERKELRFKILDAARLLFSRGGVGAVTLRAVADSIEFSPTTIYAHFSSKEGLVRELCVPEFAIFAHSLQQAERLPNAMDRLKKIAGLYVDFGLQYPGHYQVLIMQERVDRQTDGPEQSADSRNDSAESEASNSSTTDRKMHTYDYLHRAVFKAMAAGCFKPEYRDVSMLTQVLWSCLHGVVTLHMVRAQHSEIAWKPLQGILEACLENLFNGMSVPSEQSPPTWQR